MLKFNYRGVGGVIKSYDIVPVYFTVGCHVPELSLFTGWYREGFVVFDGVLAN